MGPERAEGGMTAQAGVDEQDKGEEENGEIGGDCQGPILLRQEVQAQCLKTSTQMQNFAEILSQASAFDVNKLLACLCILQFLRT